MGSNNYYGMDHVNNIGSNDHQRSSGSSSTSRKGRKNNNSSEKPKQPQRGLGVAQLEKIRLHGQMAAVGNSTTYLQTPYSSASNSSSSSSSCSNYGFQPHPQNFLMGFNEHNRANISFGTDSQATTTRWNIASNGIPEGHHFAQPSMTRHFFNPQEDIQKNERKELRGDTKNYIQNYKTNDKDDVDLELRL